MNTRESTDARNWNEWSEEKEMQVFYRNNKFLTLALGIHQPEKRKRLTQGVLSVSHGEKYGLSMTLEAPAA